EVLLRIEAAAQAGELRGEVRGVEVRDRADPALALDDCPPGACGFQPARTDGANSRDYDPAHDQCDLTVAPPRSAGAVAGAPPSSAGAVPGSTAAKRRRR